MVYVFWSNLYSIFRNEQEFHSYAKWLAVFGVLFGPLLTILGWKYQSPDVSLFDTHGALMLLLIIDVCIFTISMALTILPTFNRTHLPFFKGVFLISGVFACDLILLMLVPPFGWFICTICASVMVLLLYRSRRQILKLCQEIIESLWHSTSEALHGLCDWFQQSFQSILQCQEILEPMWHSTSEAFYGLCHWLQQSFQSVRRCQEILEPMWHSTSEAFHNFCDWLQQSFASIWTASNGFSMPTPNMKEKHVVASINNV